MILLTSNGMPGHPPMRDLRTAARDVARNRLRCVDYRAVPREIVPGCRVVGVRHHGEPYRVQWGVYTHCREDAVEKWSVG